MTPSPLQGPDPALEVAVVVLNYRTPRLVADCLESLCEQCEPARREVFVVDNASPDDSADQIDSLIRDRGWGDWARLVRSPINGGFAAGNNVGLRAADARVYILLNSDTIVRSGAVETLVRALDERGLGLVGPRLEWPDGRWQCSTFRFRTPLTELIAAGRLGWLGRRLPRHVVAVETETRQDDLDWASFACIAVERGVVDRLGPLDETYFMYFEDMDYCRRARLEGFRVGYEPSARVVHLRGGTSDVKQKTAERKRRPAYYYAARSHYFRTWYGAIGLVFANVLWTLGWMLSIPRGKSRAVAGEWRDIWADPRAGRPAGAPRAPGPGRLAHEPLRPGVASA